jgi:multidrug efflux pump subunit AcrA (membrane-fusion protein)
MNSNFETKFYIFFIFGMLFIIVIPFITWSSYATIDQISHASGNVIASAKTQEIQSAIDGVISEVLVKEGQRINKNDTIITLEKSQNEAAFEAANAKVASYKATIARLESEVYSKPLIFSQMTQKYPEFVKTQKELFVKRQQALNDEISTLKEMLKLSQEELKLNLPLVEHGDIGYSEIIKIKKQIAEINGQITNKKNKYFQDSQAELTKMNEELSTKEQELTDKSVTLERSEINASMDAIVKNILITTRGAKVRPGDVILELVPIDDKLIIEAKLSPSDISFIKVGQMAAIKLDAYDYSIYGIFKGKVSYISPDTLKEKTAEGEKLYFRVQIDLSQQQLISKIGKEINLSPGMTAQIDIITGDRTVLTYLTKPITKTFSEAFHEK